MSAKKKQTNKKKTVGVRNSCSLFVGHHTSHGTPTLSCNSTTYSQYYSYVDKLALGT